MEILYCGIVDLLRSQPLKFYLGRLVDCNRSGCDREGDIDWHMSYKVTVRLLNPTHSTQSNLSQIAFDNDILKMLHCSYVQ